MFIFPKPKKGSEGEYRDNEGLNTKPQEKWLKEVPNLVNSPLIDIFRQRLDGHHYREVVVQPVLTRRPLSTTHTFYQFLTYNISRNELLA